MFEISNTKNEITVEHVFDIAKTAILPAGTLTSSAEIDIGLDLKSSEGGDIVGKFDKFFNKKTASGLKKLHDRLEKTRTRLEKMLHDGEVEIKIRQYADTQQEDIIRDWNQFSKNDLKRIAADAVEDSIKALGKKTSVVFKDLKIGFSSTDMKDSQHEFLTGIINRPEDGSMGRAPTSGMSGMVSGLTNLSGNTGVITSAWEGNLKLLKQAVSDTNTLKSNIVVLDKTIQAMLKKLERIGKIETAANSKVTALVAAAEKSTDELEAARKTAVLNDAEKLALIVQKAQSEFTESTRKSKSIDLPVEETAQVRQMLAQAQKHLHQASALLEKKTENIMDAARRANGTLNDTKSGEKLVAMALTELKLQSKIN